MFSAPFQEQPPPALQQSPQQQDQQDSTSDDVISKPKSTTKVQKQIIHKNSQFAADYLNDNLELCDGSHVSREKLYDDYVDACRVNHVNALNSASFGKTIRSVFPTVSTRRLGTRGNSKYHYYGIKEKHNDNPLIQTKPLPKKGRNSMSSLGSARRKSSVGGLAGVYRDMPSDALINDLLRFSLIDVSKFDVNPGQLQMFLDSYRDHCQTLLRYGLQGRFDSFAQILVEFWRHVLNQLQMDELSRSVNVARVIAEWDALVYQAMLTVFLPDILGPGDQQLLTELRNFTKHLPAIIVDAFSNVPSSVYSEKARVASDFSKIVKQYHHLNHLALGCGEVTNQIDVVGKMINVWDTLDFVSITSQALYICPNAADALRIAKVELRQKLIEQAHVTQWAEWIYNMTEQFLAHEHQTFEEYMYIAQQFVIRWSYVSSLILRDICDKSKEVFGSFHMVRMFCDEYVKYLIDCKLDERRRHFDTILTDQWNPTTNVVPGINMDNFGHMEVSPENYLLSSGKNSTEPNQQFPGQLGNASMASSAFQLNGEMLPPLASTLLTNDADHADHMKSIQLLDLPAPHKDLM